MEKTVQSFVCDTTAPLQGFIMRESFIKFHFAFLEEFWDGTGRGN